MKPHTPLSSAIQFLLSDGETYESIAVRAAVSSQTIWRWCKRKATPHAHLSAPIVALAETRRAAKVKVVP